MMTRYKVRTPREMDVTVGLPTDTRTLALRGPLDAFLRHLREDNRGRMEWATRVMEHLR